MSGIRVFCPECNARAIIKKTNRKHQQISDIYCACSVVECGHTFVMNMTFSHTLSPGGLTGNKLVKFLIDRLKPDEQQLARDLLNGQLA